MLVSGFSQFAYKPFSYSLDINSANKLLITNSSHTNISNNFIGYKEKFSTFYLTSGDTILKKTYKDEGLSLDYFELLKLANVKNEFKNFE